jgi:uncharacterized protein
MSSDTSSKAIHPKRTTVTEGTWGPAAGIFMTAIAFVASQLLVSAVLLMALSIAGWSSSHIDGWLNSVFGQFAAVLFSEALALSILWLFLRRRKIDWHSLGFKRNPSWHDLGFAAIFFVIYFALFIVIAILASAFFHIDLNQKQEIGFQDVISVSEKVLTFISLVLLPPIAEETLFRGFLFGGLRKKLSFVWATLFTSLLFAAPHLFESSHGLLWIGGIDTFILSLFLCYLREKTGALWSGMIVHMLKNGVAFLSLYIFVSK